MPNQLNFSNSFGSNSGVGASIPIINGLIPVRVTEVNIIPNKNSLSLYQRTVQNEKNSTEEESKDKYWGIGSIKFQPLTQTSTINKFNNDDIAIPLNSNIRTLPLVNEIVFIIVGPSRKRMFKNGNSNSNTFYYTNSIPIWNSTDQNAYPSQLTQGNSSTNNNSTSNIEDGIPNTPNNSKEGPFLGEVFQDQGKVKNLYPQEGDVIVEGRFGNSLRFSSTGRIPGDFNEYKVSPQNPWSKEGNGGDPITILRNGQKKEAIDFDVWQPIFEDINSDASSIYLTSTQNIPLEIAYPKLNSYGIDITLPEDTTAEFQKVAETEGNEFTSNNEADGIGQARDSVNVEPTIDD